MSDHPPPLYDVGIALRQVQQSRLDRDDELHQNQVALGDKLADRMARHFPNGTAEAGTALLIAAGSVGVLADNEIPPQVVVNVVAFAGARLLESANTQQTNSY